MQLRVQRLLRKTFKLYEKPHSSKHLFLKKNLCDSYIKKLSSPPFLFISFTIHQIKENRCPLIHQPPLSQQERISERVKPKSSKSEKPKSRDAYFTGAPLKFCQRIIRMSHKEHLSLLRHSRLQ